jgi:PII-like signaling protein
MNSITKFERFDSNGLELVVDTSTGKAYASISATARMLETSRTNIQNEISKGVQDYLVTNAEIETPGGLQGCKLLSADVIFKLAFKYHPQLAMRMGAAGANVYMLGLAGYQTKVVESSPIEQHRQLPPVRDAIDYANAIKTLEGMQDSRLKRLLDARLTAELSLDRINQSQPLLAVEQPKQYTTATVRAAQLGYSAQKIGTGSRLGTFVGKTAKREFQDWQGQYLVWHYEVNDALDSAIHAYFS